MGQEQRSLSSPSSAGPEAAEMQTGRLCISFPFCNPKGIDSSEEGRRKESAFPALLPADKHRSCKGHSSFLSSH